MFSSFSAELLKLGKRPATWLIAVVWLILGLVFAYLFPYLTFRGTPTGPNAGATAAQSLAATLPANLVASAPKGFPLFAGAIALIFGVLLTGSEYGWGTLKTILTQRPTRLSVFGGKLLALAVALLLIVVATFVVDAGASALIAAIESQPINWPPADELARGIVGGWLVVAMWAWAGMFLGVLVRGTALAIGLGLVWALAVENLVRGFATVLDPIDVLQRWMPGTNAGSLVAALGVPAQGRPLGVPGVTAVVSGTHAAVYLAGCLVVFTLLAGLLLHRRDVT